MRRALRASGMGLVRKELSRGLGSGTDGTGSWCQRGEGAPWPGGHTEVGVLEAGRKTGPGSGRKLGRLGDRR